jgi:hypothetical protein
LFNVKKNGYLEQLKAYIELHYETCYIEYYEQTIILVGIATRLWSIKTVIFKVLIILTIFEGGLK